MIRFEGESLKGQNRLLSEALKAKDFSPVEIDYFSARLKPSLSLICRLLEALYRSTPLVLDIGCGVGLLEIELLKKIHYVIAIDINLKYLDFAKSYSPSCEFILADAHCLPFRRESFDAVVLHDILYTLNLFEIDGEMVRALKKGGRAFFDVHNSNFYRIFPLLKFKSIWYDLEIMCRRFRDFNLKVEGRYVVALSQFMSEKVRIPYSLNFYLDKLLSKLPKKYHRLLSSVWFSVILIYQKMG